MAGYFYFSSSSPGYYTNAQIRYTIPAGFSEPQYSNISAPGIICMYNHSTEQFINPSSISGTGPWEVTFDLGFVINNYFSLLYGGLNEEMFWGDGYSNRLHNGIQVPEAEGVYTFTLESREEGGTFTECASIPVVITNSHRQLGSGSCVVNITNVEPLSSNSFTLTYTAETDMTNTYIVILPPDGWPVFQETNQYTTGFTSITASENVIVEYVHINGLIHIYLEMMSAQKSISIIYGDTKSNANPGAQIIIPEQPTGVNYFKVYSSSPGINAYYNFEGISNMPFVFIGNTTNTDIQPKVISVNTTNESGHYTDDTILDIYLTFDLPVSVTGIPLLLLTNNRYAAYAYGNNTTELHFTNVIITNDDITILDYKSVSALSGIISNTNHSLDAELSLPAPGTANSISGSKNITIDTRHPYIDEVYTIPETNFVKAGDTNFIAVMFNEEVLTSGDHELILNAGGSSRAYVYTNVEHIIILTNLVKAGDNAYPMHYISTNAFINGTITDLAGNTADFILPSISSFTNSNYIIIDTIQPTADVFPSNGATNCTTEEQITLTFTEPVLPGNGLIFISNLSAGTLSESFMGNGIRVTITNETNAVLSLFNGLAELSTIAITIQSNTFLDVCGNSIEPFSWSFATTADLLAPSLITESLLPRQDSFIAANNISLTAVFSENIYPNTGFITIKKLSDNSIFQIYNITDTNVNILFNALHLTIAADFPESTYYVEFTPSCLTDAAGNAFAGISDTNTWFFTIDTTPPSILFKTPEHQQTAVSLDTSIDIVWSENVVISNGYFSVFYSRNDSLFEEISLTNLSSVYLNKSNMTISLSEQLTEDRYFILIPQNTIYDRAGNSYLGIDRNDQWQFSTFLRVSDIQNVIALHNPSDGTPILISKIPEGSDVQIYTTSGKRIKELTFNQEYGTFFWDLKDQKDTDMPPGIYLCNINFNDEQKIIYLFIER
jgi:hypothetical protein